MLDCHLKGLQRARANQQKVPFDVQSHIFVHWYVGEGMEEGEFAEARDGLNTDDAGKDLDIVEKSEVFRARTSHIRL